jgi:hypothetical protein
MRLCIFLPAAATARVSPIVIKVARFRLSVVK